MATETKAQHSPGPWKLNGPMTVESQDCWVCTTDSGDVNDGDQDKANALLIAAAPELLEMLQLAAKEIAALNSLRGVKGSRVYDKVCAAIAKAEGHDAR